MVEQSWCLSAFSWHCWCPWFPPGSTPKAGTHPCPAGMPCCARAVSQLHRYVLGTSPDPSWGGSLIHPKGCGAINTHFPSCVSTTQTLSRLFQGCLSHPKGYRMQPQFLCPLLSGHTQPQQGTHQPQHSILSATEPQSCSTTFPASQESSLKSSSLLQ